MRLTSPDDPEATCGDAAADVEHQGHGGIDLSDGGGWHGDFLHEMVMPCGMFTYDMYIMYEKAEKNTRKLENAFGETGFTMAHMFFLSLQDSTQRWVYSYPIIFVFSLRLVELRLMMVQPWKMRTDTSQKRWV